MIAPQANTPNQKIVVCDSDPVYLAMIETFLKDEDYRQVICVSHHAAVETIRTQQPGLVLLDMHVPIHRSCTILNQLQDDPATAAIPVIICTTNARLVLWQVPPMLLSRCAILEKPFSLEELLACLHDRLGPPSYPSQLHDPQAQATHQPPEDARECGALV